MDVLGLDQAPRLLGWACWSSLPDARPRFGLRENHDYGENDQARMGDVCKAVVKLCEEHLAATGRPIERIYYEQIVIDMRHINLDVTYSQFAVWAGVVAAARQLQVQCFSVPIGSWRARFLGMGGAPKWVKKDRTEWLKNRAMQECAARGFYPNYEPDPKLSHNIAEAIAIGEYGLAHACLEYRARTKFETRKRQDKAMIEERLGFT